MKNKRSFEPELLDLGPSHYTQEEYEQCLHQLSRIGRFLGNNATLKTLNRLFPFKSIVDFGCGGGQFSIELGKLYPKAQIIGIDISSQAIEYANKQLMSGSLKNIRFNCASHSFNLPHADIITTTLVCHHLNDDEIIHFLKSAYSKAKKAIIINDLHRHWMAYGSFAFISKIFFPNRLIYNDGLLSIKRSFKRQDWINYLKSANIPIQNCRIKWHWAFRWIIHIDTSKRRQP
jgi:2-polyprenyl-3-methyl-5-hydroxy-6-metoxy-1,4-benzoquinol methylase